MVRHREVDRSVCVHNECAFDNETGEYFGAVAVPVPVVGAVVDEQGEPVLYHS